MSHDSHIMCVIFLCILRHMTLILFDVIYLEDHRKVMVQVGDGSVLNSLIKLMSSETEKVSPKGFIACLIPPKVVVR